MKKIFACLIAVLFAVISLPTSAHTIEYDSYSVANFVQNEGGNWYDTKGNIVIKIGNDYTFNGCKILSVGVQAGGCYKIRYAVNDGYKDIEILCPNYSKYHEMMIVNWTSDNVNDKYTLRRTKEPKYFESIGGIYIGMDKNDVLKLYGQPSKIDSFDRRSIWKYSKEKFDVSFEGNVVDSITIYSDGDRRFDWSGLSARDSIETFDRKYSYTPHVPRSIARQHSPRFVLRIGSGEDIVISRDDGSVTLKVANTETGAH